MRPKHRSARSVMLHGVSESEISAEVVEICGYEDRLAGTDAERRLANRLASELESGARTSEVEPIWVQPQWAVVYLLHCLLAIVGSVLAPTQPTVAFVLVLAVATSAYLDLSARWYLLRRLLFRRASQNVYVKSDESVDDSTERVILCANLDSPRTGAAYNERPMRWLNRAARRFPVVSSPTRLWFWSIVLLLLPIGARMAGLDAGWVAFVQLPPTFILIVACFSLGEIALSPASPGANANASGIAAIQETIRRLDADPPEHLRVEIALCGGGETTMQGPRSFIRSHRDQLDRSRTRFISFESVGRGEPRFAIAGGLAMSLPLDTYLVELCAAIAISHDAESDDTGSERFDAEPSRDARTSAAFVARAYKYPAVALTCREGDEALPADHHTPTDTPDSIDPAAIERAAEFAFEVIGLLDRDLAKRDAAEPVVTSAG
jgi:hypothetical protein